MTQNQINDIKPAIKNIAQVIKTSLVILDCETSGLSIERDQILTFAAIRIEPTGQFSLLTHKIKPTIEISKEASAVHGLYIKDLEQYGEFKDYAKEIFEFINKCTLAGFNSNKFDIPLIKNQLKSAGFELDTSMGTYDVYEVFKKHNRQRLQEAFFYYLNEEIKDAHDSLGDVKSTIRILAAQLDREKLTPTEITQKYIDEKPKGNQVIIKQGDQFIWNVGKHKGKKLSELDTGFKKWVLTRDFDQQTKDIVKKFL